jgi:hypothetical protein
MKNEVLQGITSSYAAGGRRRRRRRCYRVCKQLRCDEPLGGRVWTGMTKQTAYEPHTFRRLKSTLRVLFDGLGMTYG